MIRRVNFVTSSVEKSPKCDLHIFPEISHNYANRFMRPEVAAQLGDASFFFLSECLLYLIQEFENSRGNLVKGKTDDDVRRRGIL